MTFSKTRPAADGKPQIDIAIPSFGYKSPISIDRRHAIIGRARIADAAAHDGARLREGLIDPSNTASDVRADGACRSAENERFLAGIGKISRIHRRKPQGRPMPKSTARADAKRSAARAHVEHPFARQKHRMRRMIRGIVIERAEATRVMADIACDPGRWPRPEGRAASR